MLEQILWTACITPFNKEKIDYRAMQELLKRQENEGNGILLLGSTGESLSITDKEKKDLVQFVCNLNLNTKIILGVPSYNIHSALDWMEFCNDMSINGYLISTPMYTKPGIMGQTKWFETLLNKSNKPVILYNIPERTGVELYPHTVKNLKDHSMFIAIKDSSRTIKSIAEYKTFAPNIAIYCGDDYMMPSMSAMGAIGLISVISNAWPDAVKNYVSQSLRGIDVNIAVWWQICKTLSTTSNPIPIKALMKEMGLIDSDEVRIPLSTSDLISKKELLDCHRALTEWNKIYQ